MASPLVIPGKGSQRTGLVFQIMVMDLSYRMIGCLYYFLDRQDKIEGVKKRRFSPKKRRCYYFMLRQRPHEATIRVYSTNGLLLLA